MPFHYSETLKAEYVTQGYIILRDLIPPSLLNDLRHEAETAREIARKEGGTQAQRLQPVYKYPSLSPQPFRDFLNLPELQKVVAELLGNQHTASENMGVLLEPAEKAWCTNWHRDWKHHVTQLTPERFDQAAQNLQMFNQLNAALYEDGSLWAVPKSHNRADTDAERALFPNQPPPNAPLTDDMNEAERERTCLRYVRAMPNATQIGLCAGDVAFYRACMWHIGNYVPYTRRATLHDGFYGHEDRAWQAEMRALAQS